MSAVAFFDELQAALDRFDRFLAKPLERIQALVCDRLLEPGDVLNAQLVVEHRDLLRPDVLNSQQLKERLRHPSRNILARLQGASVE